MFTSGVVTTKATKSPKVAIALLFGGLAVAAAQPAAALEASFDFSSITDQALFQTNGSAGFVSDVLRLTPDVPGQAGSAFLKQGLFIQSSADFTTSFSFRIDSSVNSEALRSDGLTFVVQGSGPGLLGGTGEFLGYRNALTGSFLPYYAIEFDDYFNASTGDRSDNEIAITRTRPGATGSVTEVVASVDLTALGKPLLDNGQIKNARIEYNFNGIDHGLSVFLSEGAASPQLVLHTVLQDDLFNFGGESTYLGFTGSTGDGFANHDLLSWSYAVPEPAELPLFGLAALALLASSGHRKNRRG